MQPLTLIAPLPNFNWIQFCVGIHWVMMQPNKLILMAVIHFVIMYFLMYSMVNSFDNVFLNLNNAYMAAIMTAPMLLIEIFLMGSMYQNRQVLQLIGLVAITVLTAGFLFIRQQTLIFDQEFIRSMIPHHSGAILMCEKSTLTDPELQQLCQEIIASQQSEIDQMKRILNRLN